MNKRQPKTVQTFECRDHLWQLFAFVADDLGCTVDYLINESMREYARSRGYSITQAIKLIDEGSTVYDDADRAPAAKATASRSAPQVQQIINPPEPVSYPGRLFVAVNGKEVEINEPSFVIGRGTRMTNLTIADSNISRRHCVIERKGSEYFISDLGSTNGIEVGGIRVEQHKIEHNLAVYICDFELRFYFRE